MSTAVQSSTKTVQLSVNPGCELGAAMRRVAFCRDSGSTRCAMGNVHCRIDGSIQFTATDGRRLAQSSIDGSSTTYLAEFLIPAECVKAIAKIGTTARQLVIELEIDGEIPPSEAQTPKRVKIRWIQNGKNRDRSIEFVPQFERFPSFVSIVDNAENPDNHIGSVSGQADDMADYLPSIDPTPSFLFEASDGSKVSITPSKPSSACWPKGITFKGAPLSIYLNVDYLREWLKVLDKQRVTIYFSGSDSPIYAANQTGHASYVLMPMSAPK